MKMPILMRVLHYYASMACVFLFLFYAVSGFIATHAEWFTEGASPTWESVVVDLPKLSDDEDKAMEEIQVFCKGLVEGAQSLEEIENDEFELWYLVKGNKRSIRCFVDSDEGSVEIFELHSYPQTITEESSILAEVSSRHGGVAENPSLDDEYNLLSFDLDSVWFEAEVLVLTDHNMYSVKSRPAHVMRAISDLHRGKHANGFQTFLADVTAVLLLFVTVTGVIIGLQMKKRKKWGIIGLAFSFVLTILLLIAR